MRLHFAKAGDHPDLGRGTLSAIHDDGDSMETEVYRLDYFDFPDVSFMKIDVEGHELDVLDGFDLARWRPRLILIEDLLLHLGVHRYLTRQGYRCLRRTGINNWYVRAEEAPELEFDGQWQLFNKFYLGTPFRRARMTWRQWTRPAV